MKHVLLALVIATAASGAASETYVPVTEETQFLALIEGKELRNRLYGVRMTLLASGDIDGAALGWEIDGTWAWQDGYFCREMRWGGDPIPYNCQLVEVRGSDRMRFTVDRGAGDSASFRLR